MTVAAASAAARPLSKRRLGQWRRILGVRLRAPGNAPSGPNRRNTRRYEGDATGHESAKTPRSGLAPFLEWLGNSGLESSPVVLAGLAHLRFEGMLPYTGGNGRIGRALAEAILLRSLPVPVYVPLSPILLRRPHEYHSMLDTACREEDATPWLLWFAAVAVESVRLCRVRIDLAIQRDRLLPSLRDAVNGRQESAIAHLFEEWRAGASLSLAEYQSLTGVDVKTAFAELEQLAALGALTRSGYRHTLRYRLAVAIPEVRRVSVADIT